MKKVFCIMGSPRLGGNSDFAATRVVEKLSGHFEVDLVRLPQVTIHRCTGCRKCMIRGCCENTSDDFHRIWECILAADIVFMVYPVYWKAPPGLMKDFIDRTHTAYLRKGNTIGKSGYLIAVATASGFDTADEIAASWFVAYGGTIQGRAHLLAKEKDDLRKNEREFGKLERVLDQVIAAHGA